METYKLFTQRIGLIALTNILLVLSSFILLPILTKNLSLSEYGVWVQVTTTAALVPNIASLGLSYTMIRFLAAEKSNKIIQERFFSIITICVICCLVMFLIFYLESNNIAKILLGNNLEIALILPYLLFFASLNDVFFNFFRTFQEMKKFSIFRILQSYILVFIVSFIILEGYGLSTAVMGLLVTEIFIFWFMLGFIIHKIGIAKPKFIDIKEYLSFGLPTIPGNISYWMVDSSDRYLIGIVIGITFVAFYSPAYTLGNIIIILFAPFSVILPSILTKYYEKQEDEIVDTIIKYSLKYFLLMAIPSMFALSILSQPILNILTTPEISSQGYFITPFIAVSALLFGVHGIIGQGISLVKKTKIGGAIWILAALINVVLNIILLPYWGILGAAVSTLSSYVLAFLLTYYYSSNYINIELDKNFLLKCVVASMVMSLILWMIAPTDIVMVIVSIVISILTYSILIYLFRGLETQEIRTLINFLRAK